MPEKKINTGIPSLDKDLDKFFNLCEGNELESIKKTICNPDLALSELPDSFPQVILRLGNALGRSNLDEFMNTLPDLQDSARKPLEKAKQLISKHFPNIKEYRFVKEYLEQSRRAHQEQIAHVQYLSSISLAPLWFGKPPKLQPAVALTLDEKNIGDLLKCSITWGDTLWLISGIMSGFRQVVEQGRSLAESHQIDTPAISGIKDSLEKIEEELGKLKRLLPVYGIVPEDDTTKNSR